MKEEVNRILQEEDPEVDYQKPILIGAGILIAYFLLFGYETLSLCFQSELHYWIFGFPTTTNYLQIQIAVISIICINLSCFGLYFFVSGLRKIRKTKGKTENKKLLVFIILYSIIMIGANIMSIFKLIYILLGITIDLPMSISLTLFFTQFFSSLVVFGVVTLVVIIQPFFLRKSKLINMQIVKRPVVHFFIPVILIIWILSLLNHYVDITPIFELLHLPFIISQIIISFLVAGVYLELVIKVKKSKQEINIKSE
ncbi:MAG: hypothetical protein GNW80_17020 [Asgard group archaeon]|nr:hypothetical protein [Asgard group archaeon]